MTDDEILEMAETLGITPPPETSIGLRRAIDQELRGLQSEVLTVVEKQRRVELTEARVALRDAAASKDLVTIPNGVLEKILALATPAESAKTAPTQPPIDRLVEMKRIVDIQDTKASADFRRARALPAAGFAAAAVAIWSFRNSFGLNLTHVGNSWFAVGAGAALVFVVLYLMTAGKAQRIQERRLRNLYDSDTQERALHILARRHDAYGWKLKFSLGGYREALVSEAFLERDWHDRRYMGRVPRRALFPSPLVTALSTVDLQPAIQEATALSLRRLQELGIIHQVVENMGTAYEVVPTEEAAQEE